MLGLSSLWGARAGDAAAEPAGTPISPGTVFELQLQLPEDALQSLRKDRRRDVTGRLREPGGFDGEVAVHLKGTLGSLRPVDDKPSFTIDVARVGADRRFHGLRKFHLNNSVEDPGYMNDALGSELFRAAGIPVPRTAHARVSLNGRNLGLFVFKEAFAEEFLRAAFRSGIGAVYEPGPGHDVNERMTLRLGTGPEDQADLKALASACAEPESETRAVQLGRVLDLDRFLSFMAMEVITGHRDGYCLARNNFRIHRDGASQRFVFLPTGMDQLFGNPQASWRPEMVGRVAQAVMETPTLRARYRSRVGELATNVIDVARLTNQVAAWVATLRRALPDGEAPGLESEAAGLAARVAERRRALDTQLAVPDPVPPVFVHGRVSLSGWQAFDPPEGGALAIVPGQGGRPSLLRISAGPRTSASWRCRVLLTPGQYRFEGLVATQGVEPLPFGKRQGACLRVAGFPQGVSPSLVGTSAPQTLSAPFVVEGGSREVELLCELRASAGIASFHHDSLRLVRTP